MITKKLLKLHDKIYICIIEKWEWDLIKLKPTQLWQYMYTELFCRTDEENNEDYITLEWWWRKHWWCYNSRYYLNIINKKI